MVTYDSVQDLTDALRRAEQAHGEYEKSLGHPDKDWPAWYAGYMQQEQAGSNR